MGELYFPLTGGDINGQVNVKSKGGRALTLAPDGEKETSVYIEAYLKKIMVWWIGMTGGDTVTLENRTAGKRLTIGSSGFKINDLDIATASQLLGVGQAYKDVTSSRKNGATYTNNSTKPIIIYVETNRTASSENDPYSIGGEVNGIRVAYRWTTANEMMSISFIVPPGGSYMFKGGWGQTHPWEPVIKVVELS